MKESEKGFMTAPILLILFIICISVSSISFLVTTQMKKAERAKSLYKEKIEAGNILKAISADIQFLKAEKTDNESSSEIQEIKLKYADYNLNIKDCSTGLNSEFLSDKILKDENVRYLIDVYGDEIITHYGWINPRLSGDEYINKLRKEFGTDNLYPMVNTMPTFNIYEMNKDFITRILILNRIPNAEEIGEQLYTKCRNGTLEEKDLEGTRIFLGTKTNFWKVEFETDTFSVVSVFAAIPEKNKNSIMKYELIEKDFKYKGHANEKI